MKIKTTYEWALEVVDEHDDIIDIWHHDDLKHYTDEQIGLVLNRNSFTIEFGATGTVLCRYELALTKRRYECLPTYDMQGNPGDDLLDLLDIGYAYIGAEHHACLPDSFVEATGKVPQRFKAAWARRALAIPGDAV
jgi:hypothetical protein